MTTTARDRVLESVLGTHRLHVSIVATPEYCGSWFEDEPRTCQGSFHLIDRGRCWVRSPKLDLPLQLHAGDLVMFPRGAAHTLASDREEGQTEGPFTTLICGEFEFEPGMRHPVVDALPDALVIHTETAGEAFRHLARLMSEITRADLPGRRLVLDKLADSLFVMTVCAFAHQAQHPQGLLAALAEPRLAKALDAMHGMPGHAWNVESLARVAGMSRTTFAAEFSRLLGVSPIHYLTDWRVASARRLLREQRLSVAGVAERLGYQSEAAFRRAFKRVTGHGPGEIRRSPG